MRIALLLRGINVGGRKLPMADLRALLSELGHTEVKTILASGQAVCTTGRPPAAVAKELHERLLADFGLNTEVLVRTGAELAKIVAACPYPTADEDGARHAVVFLDAPVTKAHTDRLDADLKAPDEYAVHGLEIYLRLPDGFADSKLAISVGKLKGIASTSRNWNTVKKLADLTA